MNQHALVAGGVFCCCLALFLGLFLGLNLPEIQVNHNFQPAICSVVSVSVQSRYCCDKLCSCAEAPVSALPCSNYFADAANKTPARCQATLASNTTVCPYQNVPCSNGYVCCKTCCDTCIRCSNVCSGSGSSRSCYNDCESYSCDCRCCSSVARQACNFYCDTCYTYTTIYSYNDVDGNKQTAVQVVDAGTDKVGLDAFINGNPPGSRLNCWYNPSDYNEVTFKFGYTAWKWVLFSFPAFSILAFFVLASYLIMPEDHARSLTVSIWMGFIIPVVILLPIWAEGRLENKGRNALFVVIMVFIGFFTVPLGIFVQGLINGHNDYLRVRRGLVYFCLVSMPIMILGPYSQVGEISPNSRSSSRGGMAAWICVGAALAFGLEFLFRKIGCCIDGVPCCHGVVRIVRYVTDACCLGGSSPVIIRTRPVDATTEANGSSKPQPVLPTPVPQPQPKPGMTNEERLMQAELERMRQQNQMLSAQVQMQQQQQPQIQYVQPHQMPMIMQPVQPIVMGGPTTLVPMGGGMVAVNGGYIAQPQLQTQPVVMQYQPAQTMVQQPYDQPPNYSYKEGDSGH